LVDTRNRNVTYADGLVLLSKEKKEWYYMARQDELGRRHRMNKTVTESKLMRISRQATPVQIMIDQKQLKNVEYFM
jgi:hypothetical protein